MNDKLRRMKVDPGNKLVEQNCSTCEFNFGNVCAGHGARTDNGQDTYGMQMEEAERCSLMVAMIMGFLLMPLSSKKN